MNRRFQGLSAIALLAFTALPAAAETPDRAAIAATVEQQHDATIKALRDWIALPTIAAEKRGTPEGAEYMRQLALDAGFQMAKVIPTDGVPGVFATLDAGAPTTLGIYFMYDVKQFDPAEWNSPPLEGQMAERPGEGTALVGRGAVNQKGPEMALLAAIKAIQASGRKLPVNLVLVAEGDSFVPIDPAKDYLAVSNNYVRRGGDGYKMFIDAKEAYDFGPDLADVVADYLVKSGPYTPFTDGRITRK